jgi:hypothetical protein
MWCAASVFFWVHAWPKVCLSGAQVTELLDLCSAFLGVNLQRLVTGLVHSCGKRQTDNSVNFYISGDTDGSMGTSSSPPLFVVFFSCSVWVSDGVVV